MMDRALLAVGIADVTFISARLPNPQNQVTRDGGWVGLGGGCFDPLPAGWVEEEKTITLRGGMGDPRDDEGG